MAEETHVKPIYFLFPGRRNTFVVDNLSIKPGTTNHDSIAQINHLYFPRNALRHIIRTIVRVFLMQRLCIAEVDLSKAMQTSDIESGTPSVHIYNTTFAKDEILTSLLHDKSGVALSSSSISDYLLDHRRDKRSPVGCSIAGWYLYHELDRKNSSMWLLVAIILSIIGGVSAGLIGDTNLGLNVGTALLAASSAVQWLLILWQG